MALLTILLLLAFVRDLSGAIRGLTLALHSVESLVFLLAGLSSTMFLYIFHKTQ